MKATRNNIALSACVIALMTAFSCSPPSQREAFMRTPSRMGAYCFSFDFIPDTALFDIYFTARFDCPNSALSSFGDLPVKLGVFSPELELQEDTLYFPMRAPELSYSIHKDYRWLYRSNVSQNGHWMFTLTPLRDMPDGFLGMGMQIVNKDYGKR